MRPREGLWTRNRTPEQNPQAAVNSLTGSEFGRSNQSNASRGGIPDRAHDHINAPAHDRRVREARGQGAGRGQNRACCQRPTERRILSKGSVLGANPHLDLGLAIIDGPSGLWEVAPEPLRWGRRGARLLAWEEQGCGGSTI